MELVRRERVLKEAIDRMERVLDAIEDVADGLRTVQSGAVDVIRAGELQREVERLRGLMEQALALRRDMDQEVAEERQRLIEAVRGRRIFETHRDAQAVNHHRAELASESKQLDELATIRFGAQAAEARKTP